MSLRTPHPIYYILCPRARRHLFPAAAHELWHAQCGVMMLWMGAALSILLRAGSRRRSHLPECVSVVHKLVLDIHKQCATCINNSTYFMSMQSPLLESPEDPMQRPSRVRYCVSWIFQPFRHPSPALSAFQKQYLRLVPPILCPPWRARWPISVLSGSELYPDRGGVSGNEAAWYQCCHLPLREFESS